MSYPHPVVAVWMFGVVYALLHFLSGAEITLQGQLFAFGQILTFTFVTGVVCAFLVRYADPKLKELVA